MTGTACFLVSVFFIVLLLFGVCMMMEAAHAFRPGRVDIFDVRTRCYMPISQCKNVVRAYDCFGPMGDDDASDLEIANS